MKAYITNNVNGSKYQVQKDSVQELNDFVAYQKAKARCPWGKLEQNLIVKPLEYPERAVFVEELSRQELSFDENFNPIMIEVVSQDEDGNEVITEEQAFETVIMHKVRIPQEFTVVIDEVPEDLRPQHLARLRGEIENILDKTDWLFISDVTIESAHRLIYKNYRAQLRNSHSRDMSYYTSDESFKAESFENYLRRVQPEQFLDGGQSAAIIKKFNSKL